MLDPPITQADIDAGTVFLRRDGREMQIERYSKHWDAIDALAAENAKPRERLAELERQITDRGRRQESPLVCREAD